MTKQEKFNFLYDFVVIQNYCLFDLFIENVGGIEKAKKDLSKLKSQKAIKNYVYQYI